MSDAFTWKTSTAPFVMKGAGSLSCDEFDDPVRGTIWLLANGWVTLTDRSGKVRSFSPSLALEIAWDGEMKEDPSDE